MSQKGGSGAVAGAVAAILSPGGELVEERPASSPAQGSPPRGLLQSR